MRRLSTTLALLAVAALAAGLLTADAVAGKKKTKNTSVVFFSGSPNFNNRGHVRAKGTLNTASACRDSRGVRLQMLDAAGVVTSVLDGASTDSQGNWSLSGRVPGSVPAGTYSLRVKANKASAGTSAGKLFCRAGVSISVPVPATK